MSLSNRRIQRELLDYLPAGDPEAILSRRDLRVLNFLMGNHRWMGRTVPPLLRPGETAIELGAGDGDLCRRLAGSGIAMAAVDFAPAPPDWPAAAPWHRADLLEFSGYGGHAAAVGNMIFHHFDEAELGALGWRLAASVRAVVACEPARRGRFRAAVHLGGPLFGAVTRHDAPVSIEAGFRGDELPRLLGFGGGDWKVSCRETNRGAYRMVAVRR